MEIAGIDNLALADDRDSAREGEADRRLANRGEARTPGRVVLAALAAEGLGRQRIVVKDSGRGAPPLKG